MLNARLLWLAPLLLGLTTFACGGGDSAGPEPEPARIVVTPDSLIVAQLGTSQLTVSILDENGSPLAGYPPTFTSADTLLATTSSTGLITSAGPTGRVEITVQAAAFTKTVPVRITAVPTTIEITPVSANVTQGDSLQLGIRVLDAVGEELPASLATFAVDNPALASVGTSGLIRSLGPSGMTLVRVTAAPTSRALVLTIAQKPTSVVVTYTGIGSVPLEGTKQFTATVRDLIGAAIPSATVTWTATGAPASVSESGLLTAESTPGRTIVQAKYHHADYGDFTGDAGIYLVQSEAPAAVAPSDLVNLAIGGRPYDVAITPAGLVVGVELLGLVISTDLASFASFDTLANGGQPATVEINAAGTHAYVAGMEAVPYQGQGWGVGVIDLASGAQSGYLHDGMFDTPLSIALSSDGQRAVMGTSAATVIIFDVATGGVRKTIKFAPEGGKFNHIVAHPFLPKMYASSDQYDAFTTSIVVEIDLVSETARKLALRYPTAWGPQGLAVSPDGTELFVADENGPMQVWDLVNDRSAGEIPAASYGFGLVLSPDGQTLYQVGGGVLAIDVATHAVTAHYNTPGPGLGGWRGAVSPDGTKIVIASEFDYLRRFSF